MSQYNYKCDSYDPYVFPSFTGYVITQSQLLFVEKNRVIDQWDLNPTGNDTNALIKAAREEADLPRNAKILLTILNRLIWILYPIMDILQGISVMMTKIKMDGTI